MRLPNSGLRSNGKFLSLSKRNMNLMVFFCFRFRVNMYFAMNVLLKNNNILQTTFQLRKNVARGTVNSKRTKFYFLF